MLTKAYQAHDAYLSRRQPVVSETDTDDELSMFRGCAKLIPQPKSPSPEIRETPPVNPPQSHHLESVALPSKLVAVEPSPVHPAHLKRDPPDPWLHETAGCEGASFAEPTQGWGILFREAPGSYGPDSSGQYYAQAMDVQQDVTLDDRWASFMHNYDILDQPRVAGEVHV